MHCDMLGCGGRHSGPNLAPVTAPLWPSIARGMVHLHSRRPAIFHRDLKPGNVFLGAHTAGCTKQQPWVHGLTVADSGMPRCCPATVPFRLLITSHNLATLQATAEWSKSETWA